MIDPQPQNYPRRILLLVSGMSPQILTETLYALSQTQEPPFLPTEVHLVSTVTGAEQARLSLLSGPRHFHALCRDYGLDESIFTADRISVIRDAEGRALADIRTPAENEATADFITNKVRELTADPDAALHVSMAGGRKTMGYYTGYALSLFGRPQDRLSHVLVSEGYEGLSEFYYPTPQSHTVYDRGGKALDTAKAEVSLAEIPFVRLRDGLSRNLLEGTHGFSQTVELASRAAGQPQLQLFAAKREYSMNGVSGKLSPVLMGILLWAAARQTPIIPPVDGEKNTEYAQELLATAEQHDLLLHGKTESILMKEGVTKTFLEPNISKLNSQLTRQLGPALSALCKLAIVHRHGKSGYGLPANLEIIIGSQD